MKTPKFLCIAGATLLILASCGEKHHDGDGHDHAADKHQTGDGHDHK